MMNIKEKFQKIKNKVAFITGAAEGIGFQIGKTFAEYGLKVMFSDINIKLLEERVEELKRNGLDVEWVKCDVVSKDDFGNAKIKTLERFGKINILVNNCAITSYKIIEEITYEHFKEVTDINIYGVILGIQTFIDEFKESDEDCFIINIASISGLIPHTLDPLYSATKSAIISISESLNKLISNHNISTMIVCPGFVKTEKLEKSPNYEILKNECFDPVILSKKILNNLIYKNLYIFTHKKYKNFLSMKYINITKCFSGYLD